MHILYRIWTSRVLLQSVYYVFCRCIHINNIIHAHVHLSYRTGYKCVAYTRAQSIMISTKFFFLDCSRFFPPFYSKQNLYLLPIIIIIIIIICSTFSLKTVTSADDSNILLLLLLLTVTRFAKNAYTIYIMHNIIHDIYCTREIDGITRSVPII